MRTMRSEFLTMKAVEIVLPLQISFHCLGILVVHFFHSFYLSQAIPPLSHFDSRKFGSVHAGPPQEADHPFSPSSWSPPCWWWLHTVIPSSIFLKAARFLSSPAPSRTLFSICQIYLAIIQCCIMCY